MMVLPIKEQEEIVKRLATRNVVKVKKKKKKKDSTESGYPPFAMVECHAALRCAGHE